LFVRRTWSILAGKGDSLASFNLSNGIIKISCHTHLSALPLLWISAIMFLLPLVQAGFHVMAAAVR
jgi:hypothetical protein